MTSVFWEIHTERDPLPLKICHVVLWPDRCPFVDKPLEYGRPLKTIHSVESGAPQRPTHSMAVVPSYSIHSIHSIRQPSLSFHRTVPDQPAQILRHASAMNETKQPQQQQQQQQQQQEEQQQTTTTTTTATTTATTANKQRPQQQTNNDSNYTIYRLHNIQ